MKVLLIQPPIADFYRTRFREYPLGLLYLHSALRREGFDVNLLDARICKKPTPAKIPAPLESLPELFSKHRGLFGKFWHFGISFDEISRRVAQIKPDAACINFMCTAYENEAIETARAVKAAAPNCIVIAGGCHATADPASLLNCDAIDIIVRGEGETVLPQILRSMPSSKVVDDAGKPFLINNLNQLLPPSHEVVVSNGYLIGKRRYAMMLTSRGCPHSCSFCATRGIYGRSFRKRDIDSVIEEVKWLVEKCGVRAIDIQDDGFMADRPRAVSILEKLVLIRERFDVEVLATNGLNPEGIDLEMANLMKRAGFTKIDLALGTGNVSSRDTMKRPEKMADFELTMAACSEAKLPVTTYFIIGMPTQPIAEMRATFEFLKKQKTLISPSVFYNVPGMPIFEEMKKFELHTDNAARRGSAFNCFGADFTQEDIVRLFAEVREFNLGINHLARKE